MYFKTKAHLHSTSDIKKEAKAQLNGQWTDAILMALIPSVFSFLFFKNATETNVYTILFEVVHGFLLTGVTFGFMNLLRSSSYRLIPFQEIASPFTSEYFKNLFMLKVWKYLLISLWTLLFIIPGIIKVFSYSQAELIYKDYVDRTGRQPDARECLRESEKLMKGHRAELFMLEFSFIGWQILNAFTLGVLGLWLTPYTSMSRVVFYENLTEGYYLDHNRRAAHLHLKENKPINPNEEVGKDPDDFRDFDDF